MELQCLEQLLMVVTKSKKIVIYTSIVIVFLGMLSLYFFWNPSNHAFFPKCPFYALTGIFCPGCGSQRAIHKLINGEIVEGIRHNYLILLLFVVLGYQSILFLLNKFTTTTYKNLTHKPITTKVILVIVILFWILRNISVFPFTELAP